MSWSTRKARALLALSPVVVAASVGFAPPAGADTTRTVCPFGCTDKKIQDAVDNVEPGGTVQVGDGNYDESVEIDKNVTIDAAPSLGRVMVSPTDGAPAFTVTAGTVTITDFEVDDVAVGVQAAADAVSVAVSNVDFDDVTAAVDDDSTAGAVDFDDVIADNDFDTALVVRQTDGEFRGGQVYSTIGSALTAAQATDTVEVKDADEDAPDEDDYDEDVSITTDVTLKPYTGSTGPVINGTVSVAGGADGATVDGFTVKGSGARISVASGADNVTVQNNTLPDSGTMSIGVSDHVDVLNNTFAGATSNAIALAHAATNSDVEDNDFNGNSTTAAIDLSGANAHVHKNVLTSAAVSGSETAVAIRVNGTADDTEVIENTVEANDIGVLLGTGVSGVELLKNTVKSNTEIGISIAVGAAGANGGHGNSIAGNTPQGVRNRSDFPADFSHNWWGSAAGPTHPNNAASAAPVPVTGDAVFGDVDWLSWCAAEGCADEPVQNNLPF